MRAAISFCLLLLATTLAAAQPTSTTLAYPEAGFQVTIPGDLGWTHSEDRSGPGIVALFAAPKDTADKIALSILATAVGDSSDQAMKTHLAELRQAVEAIESVSDIEDYEYEVAGHTARGLRVHQVAEGITYRVHLVFFRDRGLQYRIQFHAPKDQFAAEWRHAQRIIAGVDLIELDAGANEQVRTRDLARRCGSLIDWAGSWEEASKRARDEGKLIVVSIFAQPGFELSNAFDYDVFMDPEIVTLMNTRFVAWRWKKGDQAPFVNHSVFGLSGSTFGAGLLVVTPDGYVARQIFFPYSLLVADALREVLEENATIAPPPPVPDDPPVADVISVLIDSGQLGEAWARFRLGSTLPDTLDVAVQRARYHRIRRDGHAALAALNTAEKLLASDPETTVTAAQLQLEKARVNIGMGREDAAAAILKDCLARNPRAEVRARALFHQARLAWADGEFERTKEILATLVRDHPEEPVAWTAASILIGPLLKIEIYPRIAWPSDAMARMAAFPPAAKWNPAFEVEPALADAIDWLIESQQENGRWAMPFSERDTHPAPNGIALASQAICVNALVRASVEWPGISAEQRRHAQQAALKGLRRYLAERDLVRRYPRPVAFMDYTCWGSAYGLTCLSTILDSDYDIWHRLTRDEQATVRREIDALIQDLERIQAPNGGWSYYISGTVDGTSSGTAMSFTTATVLDALHAAIQQDIDLPAGMYRRGIDCLATMRGSNGVFEYMRQGAGDHQTGPVHPNGAAARGPLCTLALRDAGRLDGDAIPPVFEIFITHLGSFGREARKALMHAGLDGQGSHYLLYDYSTAAQALRKAEAAILNPDLRRKVRRAILRELARCRNADGSFLDNPLIGSSPGTGLAIQTLLDLHLDAQAHAASGP